MNARIVLFVSVALLVGVGGGFGLGQALAPSPQVLRAPLDNLHDPALDAEAGRTTKPDPRDERRPVRPDRPARPEPASVDIHAQPGPAIAADARIEVPLGTGVITGSFVDDLGSPVAGIATQLHLDVSELRPKTPQLDDHDGDVEAYFNAMMAFHELNTRLQLDATMRAISDVQGKFKFERVPDGTARIYVKPEGYVVHPGQTTFNKAAKPGDDVEIKLIRAVPVRVRVEKPVGEEPRNAWLRWTPGGDAGVAGSQSVTPEEVTTIHLVRGSYTLRASFGPRGGGSVQLEVGETPPAEVIVISAKPTRGISGAVRFSGARPQYYNIQVAEVMPDLTDAELFSGRNGIATTYATLDAKEGKFYWEQPKDGEYAVGLRVANKVVQTRRVWLGGSIREMEFVLPPPDAPRLAVTVNWPGSESQRVPGIGATEIPGNRGMGQELWLVSDKEFLLYFTAYTGNRALPARARLSVNVQNLGQVSREFVPGVETSIVIDFAEPAQLDVSVEGAPLGLRQVQVRLEDVQDSTSARQFSVYRTADGSWRRDNSVLQPGKYKATVNGAWGNGPLLFTEEWTIVSGANTQRITLPDLHTVKLDGSNLKLRGGATLEQITTNRKWNVQFDGNNVALATLLPPGQYRLSFRDPANRRESINFDFTAPSSGSVMVNR